MVSKWFAALAIVLSQILSPALAYADLPPPLEATTASALIPGVTTIIKSDVVMAENSQRHIVLCPDGMVALGGGVDLANVLTMYASMSAPYYADGGLFEQPDGQRPAPVGWRVAAVNTEATNQEFRISVSCAPISGATSVVTSAIVEKNKFNFANVKCPTGTVALGGGIENESYPNMAVSSSAPIDQDGVPLYYQPIGENAAPIGWTASAVNKSSTTDYRIKIAVVCAPVDGVTTMVGHASVDASSFNDAKVACPAHTYALSGGVEPKNILTMLVSSSAPTFNGDMRLFSQPDGSTNRASGWQATVINIGGTASDFKIAVICARSAYLGFIPYVTR